MEQTRVPALQSTVDNHLAGPDAVIFDYGGLFTGSFQEATIQIARHVQQRCADVTEESFIAAAKAAHRHQIADNLERGRSTVAEFEQTFELLLSTHADTEVELGELLVALGMTGYVAELWARVHELGEREATSMAQLVGDVRAHGCRTALLSNSFGTQFYRRDSWDELFEVVMVSGEERGYGLRKPEPAIYRRTVSLLDVSPAQCVFVDDSGANVVAARRLGMRAVLHRTSAHTRRELERFGCVAAV